MQPPIGPTMPSTWSRCFRANRFFKGPKKASWSGRPPSSRPAASSSAIRSGIFTSGGEKTLQQRIEEQPAPWAGSDALPVALQKSGRFGFAQRFLQRRERQAGPLLVERDREPFDQAQRVEHEFKRQLSK